MNQNVLAFAEGKKFRLQIHAANLATSAPEFLSSKTEAKRRLTQLKKSGYVVSLFEITPTGGVVQIR